MSVAVTGWAWRTSLGATIDGVVERLYAGERAARSNPRFDVSTYACTLAAPVDEEPSPSRHRRFLGRTGLFAVEAAAEALAHAGRSGGPRVGLFSGVGGLRAHWNQMMPALEHQEPSGEGAWQRGFRLIHPFWMLQHLSNNAHALAAEDLGTRGEGATFGGANGGAQALASAIRALDDGAVDAALVVAHDTLLEPETLVELGARGAATASSLGELAAPYDPRAAGYVPGEAAAAVVLEPLGSARAPLAIVDAADGADGSPAEPMAATLARVARALSLADVSYLDGAAWARPDRDTAERAALAMLVGEDCPLGAVGSALGALGAATAVVQVIALATFLRRGRLAPVAGLVHSAPGRLRPLFAVEAARGRVGLAVSGGAPGLAAAVRVEVL